MDIQRSISNLVCNFFILGLCFDKIVLGKILFNFGQGNSLRWLTGAEHITPEDQRSCYCSPDLVDVKSQNKQNPVTNGRVIFEYKKVFHFDI